MAVLTAGKSIKDDFLAGIGQNTGINIARAGTVGGVRRETTPVNSNPQTTTSKKWVNPLFGLAKAKGATLTLDRFIKQQQEEIERENENDQRLWGNK